MRREKPWYMESVYTGNSRDAVLALGAGRTPANTRNMHRALEHLAERGLVTGGARPRLTASGRRLQLALSLGIRPVSLLVLSAMYARIKYAGVYVKSYAYFGPSGLSDAQIRLAFLELGSKNLIFRRPRMRLFWHIRRASLKKLGKHERMILAMDAEIHS